MVSGNNRFYLDFQTDGNICTYGGNQPAPNGGSMWCIYTQGTGGKLFAMQTDGNLCLYDINNVSKWCANTYGYRSYSKID